MQCDICSRPGSVLLPLNCSTCARNALYEPRLQYAQILLQKETLAKDVEKVLTVGKVTEKSTSLQKHSRDAEDLAPGQYYLENLHSRRIESLDRTRSTLSHVEALREETKSIKTQIAARRAALKKRRTAITYAEKELLQRQPTAMEPLQKSIAKTEHRWRSLHQMSAESRVFLCREAASLFGLQKRKRGKDATGRDSYTIGGVPIIDLRDINSKSLTKLRERRSLTNRFARCRSRPNHCFHHSSCLSRPSYLALSLTPAPSRDIPPKHNSPLRHNIKSHILLRQTVSPHPPSHQILLCIIFSRFQSYNPQSRSSSYSPSRKTAPNTRKGRAKKLQSFCRRYYISRMGHSMGMQNPRPGCRG